MENIIIRQANESDRKAIAKVNTRAFKNDWRILGENEDDIIMAIEEGININVYIVAEIDGRVVGFLSAVTGNDRAQYIVKKKFQKAAGLFKGYMIAMMLTKEFEEPLHLSDNHVYFDIIGIDPAYHHQGIATQLIRYEIEHSDYKMYSLKATNINENAIKCYTKNGFKEYKRVSVKYPKQMGFSEYVYMVYEK